MSDFRPVGVRFGQIMVQLGGGVWGLGYVVGQGERRLTGQEVRRRRLRCRLGYNLPLDTAKHISQGQKMVNAARFLDWFLVPVGKIHQSHLDIRNQ